MSVISDVRCVMPDLRCVMPDVLGHPVPRRDCRSGPAMTGKVGAGDDVAVDAPGTLYFPAVFLISVIHNSKNSLYLQG